jgi:hypothetical protein
MRAAMPPLPNMPSWRDAKLKKRTRTILRTFTSTNLWADKKFKRSYQNI